jgi:hypothetical protein
VQITNGAAARCHRCRSARSCTARGGNWLTPQLSGATAPATITLNFASRRWRRARIAQHCGPFSGGQQQSRQFVRDAHGRAAAKPRLESNIRGFLRGESGFVARCRPCRLPIRELGIAARVVCSHLVQRGLRLAERELRGGTTSTPATLLLQPNTTNLNDGVYTAAVAVSTTAAGVAPKVVNVQYTVQAFSLRIYPGLNGCSGCHTTPNTSAPTASQWYSQMQPYFPAMMCRIIPGTSCIHTKVSSTFAATISSWYNAGAPNR